jgi:hypothetical protein
MCALLLASATATNFGDLRLEKLGKPTRRPSAASNMLDHGGSLTNNTLRILRRQLA